MSTASRGERAVPAQLPQGLKKTSVATRDVSKGGGPALAVAAIVARREKGSVMKQKNLARPLLSSLHSAGHGAVGRARGALHPTTAASASRPSLHRMHG